jgi:hypothetical protein
LNENTDRVIGVGIDFLVDLCLQFKACSKRKRKPKVGNDIDEVAEEEIPAADIPPSFKNFVMGAIEKYNRLQSISSVEVASEEHSWKNADGEQFSYFLHTGDVRMLDGFLLPRSYTLAVADIPYGFNAPGAEYDDQFMEQDILDMVTRFSNVTTSKIWRFVIIHSLQQTNVVMSCLEKVCNCGVEAGIWEKTNINQYPSGPRLAWAFENWTVGYYCESGVRTREMYNFGPYDSRSNIVKRPCVTKKSMSTLGFIVNPYQKPVGLGDWFVNHFSEKGDWVADLCCGTGSTLAAALLNSRHGCAVDRSSTQIEFVRGRVITLESEWSLYDEAQEVGEGVEGNEVQPPVGGELGSIATLVEEVVEEEVIEVEGEAQEKPRTPNDADFNEMLMD